MYGLHDLLINNYDIYWTRLHNKYCQIGLGLAELDGGVWD